MQHQIHPNIIRQGLFLAVLILLTYIIGKEMKFLLGSLLGAITLYVLMRNPMYKLIIDYRWKKWLAALTMMLLSLVLIVLPTLWVGSVLLDQITPIINNPGLINKAINTVHEYLKVNYDIDLLNKDNMNQVNAQVMPFIQETIGSTLSGLGSLAMMYLLLYFMLTGSGNLERWLRTHVPFKNSNSQLAITEFRNLVYSNALGIPLVAIVQGLVGLVGYAIFGVKDFMLMGVLTAICSVIPVVGAMVIYIPLAVFQLANGYEWQGVGIFLWGFILIGSVDNVARFIIQKRLANLHPLITILGVIMGINLFGFLGIIFGPLLLSMFFLLVKIYIDEFGKADAEQLAQEQIREPKEPAS